MKRIVIFSEDPGWHGDQLSEAFAAHGYGTQYVSLKECRLNFSAGAVRVSIPGFEHEPPAGAFVRGVPGGTLEQIVTRLNILHALNELGVPIYNDGRAIERTVDKAMTSFLLSRGRISTPATWVCESAAQARSIVLRETAAGREVVMKPLFGSQGIGLMRLCAGVTFPDLGAFNHVAYLQEFIAASADYRILVMNGTAIAQMRRRGLDWINNVARGGRPEPVALDAELKDLAEAAAASIGIDYCGVDVLRDEDGRSYVLEVNGIPAWRGLQTVTEFDIAQTLVADFLARHVERAQLKAVS